MSSPVTGTLCALLLAACSGTSGDGGGGATSQTGGATGLGAATGLGGAAATGLGGAAATGQGGAAATGLGAATGQGGAAATGQGGAAATGQGGAAATGKGGAAATGGATSSGGAVTVGGSSATGGMVPKGGATATGGVKATGGRSSLGGSASTGGANAIGGATASGGALGSAGATGGGGAASPGCNSVNTTSPCTIKSGTKCTLEVNGKSRTYYIELPTTYSASKPYPMIFQFHPMGGNAEQVLQMPAIKSSIPDAIYIAPQGLTDSSGSTGWPNSNGEDIAFTKAMLADVQAKFCVDSARIFSTGFSYGGIMSDNIACQMPDVFRAIAPIAGMLFTGTQSCKKLPIAAIFTHGSADTVNDISGNVTVRDYLLGTNHCLVTTKAIEPSPCVAYDGCDAGKPVVWCEHTGGHMIPSFAASAIAAFFKQF